MQFSLWLVYHAIISDLTLLAFAPIIIGINHQINLEEIKILLTNSNPLVETLNYIKAHPDAVTQTQTPYQNVVRLFVPTTIQLPAQAIYFPADRLVANRLTDDVVDKAKETFAYFAELCHTRPKHYSGVWLTTAFLRETAHFMLELSFE